ncbi:MAG: DNA internalization-related competence protein ComEC/Rec2 [Methylophilaceae bacterium]
MIIIALGFVFGAWLLQQQPVLPSLIFALILAPATILVLKGNQSRCRFSHIARQCNLFIFAALFGFFYATIVATIRLSDELPREWEQQKIELIGVIATLPEATERGERFQFDVESVITPGAVVPKHISLNYYHDSAMSDSKAKRHPFDFPFITKFQAGQRWQWTVRLKRPHTTYNPHGFDFEAWALAQNSRATGTIRNKSGYQKLDNLVWRQGFLLKPGYVVEYCRAKIGQRITQALVNQPYAGVIRALVIGDDSQISRENWNIYLRTGTIHLMSISGLHITMLAGLVFGALAFVWRRNPGLVMRLPTQQAATIGGALAALTYACLAGFSVPTQRTLYMLATFAVALFLGKQVPISRVLATALLAVVVLDPWAVIAPGFWLSFSAVALIAYVTVNRLALRHWLREAINTQWAITLGLLPLLILMFGQASMISPVANALAIPIISLIVVPLAILGSLLPLDFILHASHIVLELCMQGLDWLARSPMATWQQAAAPVWTIGLAIAGALCLLLPRGFPQRWLGLILLLPMLFVNPSKLKQGEMKVTVLDVGQGLAVLVQTAKHAMLYDAGPSYSKQSDAGSRIIMPFLRGEGIKKLDGAVISHDDIDHSGGIASILSQMPVSWLASSFASAEIMQSKPTQLRCFSGKTWTWDAVRFEMLYPALESYQHGDIKDNNRSCVVKVTSRHGSVLLTGDIEKQAEIALLATKYDQLASDVLLAPHHGSKTSSSIDFVAAVGAQHTIFTVGYLNRFKHPKALVENRYAENGAVLHRSDRDGAIIIHFSSLSSNPVYAWRKLNPKYWHDKF